MSEEIAKTAADHVTDTLTQLKEMRHYSKANVERLTATWLLFDGELSKLKQTEKIDDLMNRQSQLHDALETLIADLEDVLQKMQPLEACHEFEHIGTRPRRLPLQRFA
jgi:citrate synthase